MSVAALSVCLSQPRSQGFVPGKRRREKALGTRLCLSVLHVSSVWPFCLFGLSIRKTTITSALFLAGSYLRVRIQIERA